MLPDGNHNAESQNEPGYAQKHFDVMEMASSLKPHELASVSLQLFFCSFLTFLGLHKIKES